MLSTINCFDDLALGAEIPAATDHKEHCLYVIKHLPTDLTKIGITGHLARRCRQLDVGGACELITARQTDINDKHEAVLHDIFKSRRLPGTEWFCLGELDQKMLLKRTLLIGKPATMLEKLQSLPRPPRGDGDFKAQSLAERFRIWSEAARKADDAMLEKLTYASAALFKALADERTYSTSVESGTYVGMSNENWDEFVKDLLRCSMSLADAYSELALDLS